jgi:3-oxoacyl-[acyl-carrier protein] reductase
MSSVHNQFSGQVFIVTGAAQGIGKCIAEHLAADGATLLLCDIQEKKVNAVAKELQAGGATVKSTKVDIANIESVEAMVATTLKAFGRIDGLVNNAAIDAPLGNSWEIDADHWNWIIDVNLSGAWWVTRSVIPHMIEQRKGKIVTISSLAARQGGEHSPAYAAAKAGLIGLTTSLATQLEPFNILVNCITPGMIGTGADISMSQREKDAYREKFPLGIVGPQPIAEAVGYLLADSGNWVSGTVMNVSGGAHRGI